MKGFNIGEKIRKLKKEKGMSLRELAGEYVSKAQLSYIENGKASPNIELLEYLSHRLDVDLGYLLETEKDQIRRYCKLLLEEMKVQVKLNDTSNALNVYEKLDNCAQEYDLSDMLAESSFLLVELYMNIKSYDIAIDYIQKSSYLQ